MTSKARTSKAGAAAYEEAVTAGQETIEQAVKATTDAATKGYEQVMAAGQKNIDAAVRNYDELTALSKDTVEAWLAAGNVAGKGVEAFNAEMMAFAKGQVEDSVAATKAVMGAKTLQEAMELQAEFAKTTFDAYVSEGNKLGEMWAKTAQEVFGPINTRYTQAFEKLTKTAA